MSGQHSLLGPSKAHRWARCTASLAASKHIPELPSEYAAEGTVYHQIAEWALRTGGDTAEWLGREVEVEGFKFIVTAENLAHLAVYLDAIKRLPGFRIPEVDLDVSAVLGVPDQTGTADCVTLDFERELLNVDDLKFGRGEIVYAKDNEQLVLYGASALVQFDFAGPWSHVRVAIHQPRANHYDEHIYTRAEIELLAANMGKPARIAADLHARGTPEQIRAAMMPGEKQCRWCPIRGSCAARSEQILAMFSLAEPEQERVGAMTDAELAAARDRVEQIEQWCKDIKEEALGRAKLGRAVPGWKLVEGRKGPRGWKPDDLKVVEATLVLAVGEDVAYEPRTIISPTAAETALKKNKPQWAALQSAIKQSDGAPTLVRDLGGAKPGRAVSVPEFSLTVPEDQ